MVEIEQAAETLPSTNAPCRVTRRHPRDQPIAEPLVIPFAMIVLDILRHRVPEVPLPERNHPIETFFLDGPHESLGIRIRVRLPDTAS